MWYILIMNLWNLVPDSSLGQTQVFVRSWSFTLPDPGSASSYTGFTQFWKQQVLIIYQATLHHLTTSREAFEKHVDGTFVRVGGAIRDNDSDDDNDDYNHCTEATRPKTGNNFQSLVVRSPFMVWVPSSYDRAAILWFRQNLDALDPPPPHWRAPKAIWDKYRWQVGSLAWCRNKRQRVVDFARQLPQHCF